MILRLLLSTALVCLAACGVRSVEGAVASPAHSWLATDFKEWSRAHQASLDCPSISSGRQSSLEGGLWSKHVRFDADASVERVLSVTERATLLEELDARLERGMLETGLPGLKLVTTTDLPNLRIIQYSVPGATGEVMLALTDEPDGLVKVRLSAVELPTADVPVAALEPANRK